MTLQKQLRIWLAEAERVTILGIGSTIRGDDGVGPVILKKLRETEFPENVRLFDCETVPEVFTGLVKKFNPTHIILVDSAHLGAEPGEAKLVPADKIRGMAVSTHALPLSLLAEYLQRDTKAKIILIGIQPKTLVLGSSLTSELKKAADDVAKTIVRVLGKQKR